MQELFTVLGSKKDLYSIEVDTNNSNLKMTCDCPAGTRAQLCKHRLEILSGAYQNVTGLPEDKLDELILYFKQSELGNYLRDLHEIEKKLDDLNKQRKSIRRGLGRRLEGM